MQLKDLFSLLYTVAKITVFANMESLKKNIILEFNQDTLGAVRKIYGLDKSKEMNEAIDLLEAWVKKQDHFVKKDFSRDFLERTIIMSAKGSVERAKTRLDKLCTLRTLLPHFFEDHDIGKEFKVLDEVIYGVLPKLTNDQGRVFFIKIKNNKDLNSAMLLDGYKFCAMIYEYLRTYDYADSHTVVVDILDGNVANLISNVNLNDMRQVTALTMEGYGVRNKGIHMLTSSKLIDTLVTLMKQVLSAKLGGRIHIHSSIESIYEYVPKDILPIEYGGKERPLEEIKDKWVEVLSSDDFKKCRQEMSNACTDETRRQKATFNENYMGMPGTFRTLSVD